MTTTQRWNPQGTSARLVDGSKRRKAVVAGRYGTCAVEWRRLRTIEDILLAEQGVKAWRMIEFLEACKKVGKRKDLSVETEKNLSETSSCCGDRETSDESFPIVARNGMFLLWKRMTEENKSRKQQWIRTLGRANKQTWWDRWITVALQKSSLRGWFVRWKLFLRIKRSILKRLINSRLRILRRYYLHEWKEATIWRKNRIDQFVWERTTFFRIIRTVHIRHWFFKWVTFCEMGKIIILARLCKNLEKLLLRLSLLKLQALPSRPKIIETTAHQDLDPLIGRPPCTYVKKNYRALKKKPEIEKPPLHSKASRSSGSGRKVTFSSRKRTNKGPYVVSKPQDKRFHLTKEEILANRMSDVQFLMNQAIPNNAAKRDKKKPDGFELWKEEEIILTNSFVPGGHKQLQHTKTRQTSTYWI